MIFRVNLNKISGSKKKKNQENREDRVQKINNEDFKSNLMKIVVNFLQVSTIIFQYKFEWPNFVLNIVNVTNKFIPTNAEGFSVDCLVALSKLKFLSFFPNQYNLVTLNNRYIYFIKLVVTLIEPFVLWFTLIAVYLAYLKYKKEPVKGNPKVKKNIVVLFVITAFIVQPSLIQATLELFK